MKIIEPKLFSLIASSVVALTFNLPAQAGGLVLNTTVTADNHYKLVTAYQDASQLKVIGRNEVGPFNIPDTTPPVPNEACPDDAPFSWSCPEAFSAQLPLYQNAFYVYSFVWGESAVRRAFLGDFEVLGCDCEDNVLFVDNFSTDTQWEVTTVEDFNPGDFGDVSASRIATEIVNANTNNSWVSATSKGPNVETTLPWKRIPGISSSAEFIASDTLGDDEDSLLFRRLVTVPVEIPPCTPEPSMLLSLGAISGMSLLFKRKTSKIEN